jgi:hypothetical protein
MTIAQPIPTGHGDERKAHLFDPIVENRRSSVLAGPLRVVAFNAMGGTNLEGILKCLAREPLRSTSVLLVSETDAETKRTRCRMVASVLARELGMSCAFVPEFELTSSDGVTRSFLGNAILAREPMQQVFAVALPKLTTAYRGFHRSLAGLQRKGNPAAIIATIAVHGKPIHICVAHLDSRADPAGRALQIATLLDGFPPEGPAILGGDLNTTTLELINPGSAGTVFRKMIVDSRRFQHPRPYEPLFNRLADAGFEVRGANLEGRPTFTFTRLIPPWFRPRLDWFALRGLQPIPGSASVIPARPGFFSRRVSDHDFISVDIAI